MCNAWNHPADCTCGWGGEGHLGQSSATTTNVPAAHASWHNDGVGLRWLHSDDLCRSTSCPQCRRPVFFVRHNGGSVWFDELGWPWPIHPCFLPTKPRTSAATPAFTLHQGTNTTAAVAGALQDLVGTVKNARIGLATHVIQLGPAVRLITVTTGDGEDRYVVIEHKMAPSRLVGTIAVYSPTDLLVNFLCGERTIRGWWFDQPPGSWRNYSADHVFGIGDLTYHKSFNVGAVVEVLPSGMELDQKVKIALVSGKDKTFSAQAASLLWLERTWEYEPEVPLGQPAEPRRIPAPVAPAGDAVRAEKQPCPHCGWNVKNLRRHLRNHHPELAG
jgi:hypothetical protein